MWFKTRVGFSSIMEPFEVRVAKYPEDRHPSYLIYARSLNDSDVQYKGFLGNLKAPGRYVHLARFELSEKSEPEIAACMTMIEEAIAIEARICDLSGAGAADVWTAAWNQWVLVKWEKA